MMKKVEYKMTTDKKKKNIKIVALAIVAIFTLGIVGIAVAQTQVGFAAPATSSIGYVNRQNVMMSHPEMEKVMKTMQEESVAAQKDFEEKASTMPQQEQERYAMQLQQRLAQKETDLMKPIIDQIEAEIKKIAEAKGLTVVVDAQIVIYGGTDITADVIKGVSGK